MEIKSKGMQIIGCLVVDVFETNSGFTIFKALENNKWHLSVNHKRRVATWSEIKELRYKLCPKDITMAILFPPENQYVNLAKNCIHLWEV